MTMDDSIGRTLLMTTCHAKASEDFIILLRPAIHFLHFANVFVKHTTRNTKHSPYIFHISCEFRVLLMPRNSKPWNPLTFRANADPGAKKRGVKREKSDTKYPAIHFLFFAFHDSFRVFCDKRIAGLTVQTLHHVTSGCSLFWREPYMISMVTCPTCLTNIFVENESSTEIGTQACRLSACI